MLSKYLLVRSTFWVFLTVVMGCRAETMDCQPFLGLEEAGLKDLLTRGGFSGELDASSSFKYVGCYDYEDSALGVYFYEREFGKARLTQRLIIISSSGEYLGMYAVPEPPESVVGSNVKFPFPNDYGNHISLKGGVLPRAVFLDGEEFELFK